MKDFNFAKLFMSLLTTAIIGIVATVLAIASEQKVIKSEMKYDIKEHVRLEKADQQILQEIRHLNDKLDKYFMAR